MCVAATTKPSQARSTNHCSRRSATSLPREAIVGSGKDVADRLEKWFVERACDGFVVAATHIPGAFEDFVRYVVPELQRRGIYHKDYTGATLRENLGLPHPPIGWWKQHA